MNRTRAALQVCEARLSHLSDKSAHCCWEQDADFRFTYFSGPFLGHAVAQHPGLGRHLWDTPVRNLSDAEWATHRALLRRHDSFSDFQVCFGDDSNPQWFSLSGEPMFDEAGAFQGYRGVVREVTDRRLRDEALLRFRAAIDSTADGIHVVDCESMRFIEVNETGHRFLGYTREEFLALQIPDIAPNMDMQVLKEHYQSLSTDAQTEQWAEVWLQHRDGRRIPVEIRRRGALIGGQRIAVNVLRDITRAKQSERIIRRHALQQTLIAAFGQSALSNIGIDALLERAASAVCEGLEVDFCRLHQLDDTGQHAVLSAGNGWDAGWVASTDHDLGAGSQYRYVLSIATPVVVEDFTTEARFVVSALLRGHAIRSGVDLPIVGARGSYGVLGVYSKERRLFTSEHLSYLLSLVNILATAMDRKRAEDRLTELAQFDALTGLPNRSLFLDRFEQTLATGERDHWRIGVLFIDLDQFKTVNDTLGHAAGDRLLIQVAHRLKECVRPGDTVGRLSGDEFAIVLANLSRTEDAGLVAQKVVAALRLPFMLEADQVHISASVGIAIYPGDGLVVMDLMKNADRAMYDAKAAGRNTFR